MIPSRQEGPAAASEREDRLFAELSRDEPLAHELSERRLRRMIRVACRRLESLTVVAENLWDPHNVSAVIRTAEGIGLDAMHVVETPNPFKISRGVTHGAERWLEIHRHAQLERCISSLAEAGFLTAAADLGEGCVPLEELPEDRSLALVFGSEKAGLTDRARTLTDLRFTIPMHGFTGSFNVSVSAAVSLHRLASRRRRLLGRDGELDDRAVRQRVVGWLHDTLPSARRGPKAERS
jgi:tRNA (guanosine-2'-O-)-methyltransferase